MTIFAFACSLLISLPECPPQRPVTFNLAPSPSAVIYETGIEVSTVIPPAQLVRKCPSSSESIFNILWPLSIERSIESAPSIPISSSTVITTSRRGCAISGESIIASAYATAIPSSPPSVVPLAFKKSPST